MDNSLSNRHEGKSKPPWGLLVLALVASASAVVLFENGDTQDWDCAPVTPGAQPPLESPCFTASVAHQNLVTLSWRVEGHVDQVYIYSDKPTGYSDPGIQPARCPAQNGICSVQIPLEQGGYYRWTLAAGGGDMAVHVSAEIEVPVPAPPVVYPSGDFVDLLAPSAQALSWTTPTDPDLTRGTTGHAWVEVRKPGARRWEEHRLPESGHGASLDIPAEQFSAKGEQVYSLRRCHYPTGSSHKLCSQPSDVGFRVGYDHFIGLRNRHAVAGEPLDIEFSTLSGNARFLSSATLIDQDSSGMITTTESSIHIPGELVTPGTHELELNSCLLPAQKCSNRQESARADSDGLFWQRSPGSYAAGEVIGTLFPDDGPEPILVHNEAAGNIIYTHPGPIYRVRNNEVLAHSIGAPADMLRLVVGSPMKWTVNRHYTQDFHPGTGISIKGFGQALDITFDDAGGIWMSNEFSNGTEHITANGEAVYLPFPLARIGQHELDLGPHSRQFGTAHPLNKPFSFPIGTATSVPTSISSLAEKVVYSNGHVWFTQGGGLLAERQVAGLNRSRVVSFNTQGVDSHKTPYDDRFCVYDIPSDPAHGLGNNQIVGLALARGRVWVAETRGVVDQSTAYLSSFIPNPEACSNMLDFSDPEAMAALALKYCLSGQSPEQDGCVDRVPMPETQRAIKIVHLEADREAGLLWFTDASGQYVGSFDIDGAEGFTLYPIPETHYREYDTIANLGGFPWDLQVTANAVYVGEYATRHILRLDKNSGKYDEVLIPYTGRRIRLHSLALDSMRERLWFTLANECAVPGMNANSTLGYIDLHSWDEYVAATGETWGRHQVPDKEIMGVIYSGLDTIPTCAMHPGQHQSFRGIAIEPGTGRIAMATMLREQVTLLRPLPGFWP